MNINIPNEFQIVILVWSLSLMFVPCLLDDKVCNSIMDFIDKIKDKFKRKK